MKPSQLQLFFLKIKYGPLKPFRFKVLRRLSKMKSLKILDVGCGNESYGLARKFLNISDYVGIDKVSYDGEEGYTDIPKVIFLDLDSNLDELDTLDNDFDLIIMSHIIEHTKKFEIYSKKICDKLKKGGILYIETPHPRTLDFPSAMGFLNFYDDDTHVRCFSQNEVEKYLIKLDMNIVSSGTRRDIFRIIFISPIIIAANLFYFLPLKRKIFASGLWDLLGVAFYVAAERK